jgi:hypothetical protein
MGTVVGPADVPHARLCCAASLALQHPHLSTSTAGLIALIFGLLLADAAS